MGFTLHKLYPSTYETIAPLNCCDVTCACIWSFYDYGEGGLAEAGAEVTILERCVCPLITYLGGPEGSCCTSLGNCGQPCSTCMGFPAFCFVYSLQIDLSICTLQTDQCKPKTIGGPPIPPGGWIPPGGGGGGGGWSGGDNPCANEYGECCPARECWYTGYRWLNNGGEQGEEFPIRPNLNNCVVTGAKPHTYKIENLSVIPNGYFVCSSRPSDTPSEYDTFEVENDGTVTLGQCGDPAFTRNKAYQRFYKSPDYPLGSIIGATASYSPFCIKIHNTATQNVGIENRTMVLSGKNIYRYAGYFSGDPILASADPFWDNPGGSGIKQIEESISDGGTPRTFPLPDSVLQLPLWGQTANNNLGIIPPESPDPCPSPIYIGCPVPGGSPEETCPVCVGCVCVRSNPKYPNTGTGHYGTDYDANTSGYTAGYFSFAEFNPESYLDHRKVIGFGSSPTVFREVATIAGNGNVLGFGALGGDFFPSGVSGATSHGPRLGVPTCSVWTLVKALYSRVLWAYMNNDYIIQFGLPNSSSPTETNFRTANAPNGFKSFSDAVDAMLGADPSGTNNGTSNVQYHFAKVQEALKKDSTQFIETALLLDDDGYFEFTFPNVFLWDHDKFVSASATDKWKHLYVVGNGNVMYDSRSIAVTGPYDGTIPDVVTSLHDDVRTQNYMSSVFYLHDTTHTKGCVTSSSNQARLVVFPGSGGPTTVFDGSNGIYRKNASASFSLAEMNLCADAVIADPVSPSHYDDGAILASMCSICNALPNPLCVKDVADPVSGVGHDIVNGAPCSPVTIIDDGVYAYTFCNYIGGNIVERNGVTASYQI